MNMLGPPDIYEMFCQIGSKFKTVIIAYIL